MEAEKHSSGGLSSNVIPFNIKSYRIVLIGHNDEIVYVRKFNSIDDRHAINIAENMYNDLELDLWEETRHVKNMPARRCHSRPKLGV